MREFLDDVHAHMDAGIGRAQGHAKNQLRKRFYKLAGVEKIEGGFSVVLDGRPTKTPGRVNVVVPHEELALLLVKEWEAQETHIEPKTMPMVRLVNSAIEGGTGVAEALREEVVKFAGNDLLLFRAESPKELVILQNDLWGAALNKLEAHFGVLFEPVTGIIHKEQPTETIARLTADLQSVETISLTALVSITGLTGSGLLALALRHGLITPDEAWATAHVDEDYNAKNWGADAEAISRLEKRRREFDAAVTVLALVDRD